MKQLATWQLRARFGEGALRVRFGEVEARGIALTAEGPGTL